MASNNNALALPAQPAGTNVDGAPLMGGGLAGARPSGNGTNVVQDIRPLKGPVEIPSTYGWLWWVLAALVAAAVVWLLWRKLRFKKPALKPAVIIPPHRKAKDRLRGAGELMSDPYAFCSLVSDVLRSYVEERFNLHAPERTTEEFMDELRASTQLRPDHKLLLEDFLSRCDLVKFARFEPAEPELRSLLESAERFVDETAPVGETENKAE